MDDWDVIDDFDTPATSRDWDRMQSQFATEGYREGLDYGKEAKVQDGFNKGFSTGAKASRVVGVLMGLVQTALALPRSSSATLDSPADAAAPVLKLLHAMPLAETFTAAEEVAAAPLRVLGAISRHTDLTTTFTADGDTSTAARSELSLAPATLEELDGLDCTTPAGVSAVLASIETAKLLLGLGYPHLVNEFAN